MKKVTVTEFIESLGVKIPPLEEFWKLGDMTALWTNEANQFVKLDYYRGPLLYALVAKHRPKTVLEFGRAKGYATLCMAWAMDDFNIDGTIYTLDTISPDQHISMPIKRASDEPTVVTTSVNEIWNEIARRGWTKRIIQMTGLSSEIMRRPDLPKFEMAYIDADHFYRGVRHDFYSFLKCSEEKFGVLFDDYIEREGFGVKRLVDNEVSENFDVTLIYTDLEGNLKEHATTDYGMCWIHTDSLKKPLNDCYSIHDIQKILDEYKMFEKRLKVRKMLNQRFPILKKIKLRWWDK